METPADPPSSDGHGQLLQGWTRGQGLSDEGPFPVRGIWDQSDKPKLGTFRSSMSQSRQSAKIEECSRLRGIWRHGNGWHVTLIAYFAAKDMIRTTGKTRIGPWLMHIRVFSVLFTLATFQCLKMV